LRGCDLELRQHTFSGIDRELRDAVVSTIRGVKKPGKPFTPTFLYGAYDGEITFFEPMITNESLVAAPRACAPVKLPQQYAETAHQPTRYCTEFDANKQVVRVFLSGFCYRSAAAQEPIADMH
jgi:hypothetical protein